MTFMDDGYSAPPPSDGEDILADTEAAIARLDRAEREASIAREQGLSVLATLETAHRGLAVRLGLVSPFAPPQPLEAIAPAPAPAPEQVQEQVQEQGTALPPAPEPLPPEPPPANLFPSPSESFLASPPVSTPLVEAPLSEAIFVEDPVPSSGQ